MIKRSLLALLLVLPLLAAEAVPGWIGIGYLYKRTDNRGWMLIQHLDPSGPAAKGGLRAQDIVTHIDGKPLTVPDQYAMMKVLRNVSRGRSCGSRCGAATGRCPSSSPRRR